MRKRRGTQTKKFDGFSIKIDNASLNDKVRTEAFVRGLVGVKNTAPDEQAGAMWFKFERASTFEEQQLAQVRIEAFLRQHFVRSSFILY